MANLSRRGFGMNSWAYPAVPGRVRGARWCRRWLEAALVWMVFVAVSAAPHGAAGPRVLMVLGDSLSAGYGIDVRQGWVQLLQERLAQEGMVYRVVNASISGDTTSGGRVRLPQALTTHRPTIVVVELGGNDGLRGLEIGEMQRNLGQLVTQIKDSGAQALLVGMRIPPNYGLPYATRFQGIYRVVAEHFDIPLVPFLLEGVAQDPNLMQPDGIHPRAEAQPRILDNVWPHLQPLL